MPKARNPLNGGEAEAIARLSALENMREQARAADRASMLSHIEKLIQSELRGLENRRARNVEDGEHAKS